jgi:hypothetical protein
LASGHAEANGYPGTWLDNSWLRLKINRIEPTREALPGLKIKRFGAAHLKCDGDDRRRNTSMH